LDGVLHDGYARLARTWCNGDRIELDLPQPVERVYAHPAVAENIGRVALRRGPLVYCLEQADNQVPLHTLGLRRGSSVTAEYDPHLLGGVVKLHGRAAITDAGDWSAQLYRGAPAVTRGG